MHYFPKLCFVNIPQILISRWSRGNVLASRSKVRGFKPDWGRWILSGRTNPEHKSSGRDFNFNTHKTSWTCCINKERPTRQKQQPLDGRTVENKGKLILTINEFQLSMPAQTCAISTGQTKRTLDFTIFTKGSVHFVTINSPVAYVAVMLSQFKKFSTRSYIFRDYLGC